MAVDRISYIRGLATSLEDAGFTGGSMNDFDNWATEQGCSTDGIRVGKKDFSRADVEAAIVQNESDKITGYKRNGGAVNRRVAAGVHAINAASVGRRLSIDDDDFASKGGRRPVWLTTKACDLDNLDDGGMTEQEFTCAVVDARTKGKFTPKLERYELKAASGQGAGSGSIGGFTMPQQMEARVWQSALQMNPWLAMIDTYEVSPGTGSGVTLPTLADYDRSSGEHAGFKLVRKGEGDAFSEDIFNFEARNFQLGKAGGIAHITHELLYGSAIGMQDFISARLGECVGITRGYDFISGSGVAEPLGVLNASADLYTLTKETSQTADTIRGNNLVKMLARMEVGGMTDAIFLAHPSCIPTLSNASIQAVTDLGTAISAVNSVWLPSLREGSPGTICGRPLYLNENNPLVGDKGDILLLNPRAYRYVTAGISIDVSEHYKFNTDQISLRVRLRDTGAPIRAHRMTDRRGYEAASFVCIEAR